MKPPDTNNAVFQYASEKPEKKERVYVWGNAEYGALGQPTFLQPRGKKNALSVMHKPYRLPFAEFEDIKALSCGYGFTVLVPKGKGKVVFGTGFNQDGQIGYHQRAKGKPLEILIEPTKIDLPLTDGESVEVVSCGRAHTLLVTSRGRLLSLGNNAYGQAGRPVIEEEDYARNQLINQIKLDHKILHVYAGQDHSLLVTEEGKVLAAGWGSDGQTGLGHYNNCGQFTELTGDIKGEKIVKIACRADCVLALNDKGEVFGWGNSEYGQFRSLTDEQQINTPRHLPLGIGRVKDIASGGTVCLALNEDGEVYVWGYGILGKGPRLTSAFKPERIPGTLFGINEFSQDTQVTRIYAGLGHQAALNSQGDLYIWGKNRNKCLGLGDQEDQFFPLKVAVAGRVKQVDLGVDHTAVIATAWSDR